MHNPRMQPKPWLTEFEKYLCMPDGMMSIPEGVDLVQWWGVRQLFFESPYTINLFCRQTVISIPFGPLLRKTILQLWLLPCRVNAPSQAPGSQ